MSLSKPTPASEETPSFSKLNEEDPEEWEHPDDIKDKMATPWIKEKLDAEVVIRDVNLINYIESNQGYGTKNHSCSSQKQWTFERKQQDRQSSGKWRDSIGDHTTLYNEIVLEIPLQPCSRRSVIGCYKVAMESSIQSSHFQWWNLIPSHKNSKYDSIWDCKYSL
jgi:hypothetical protein